MNEEKKFVLQTNSFNMGVDPIKLSSENKNNIVSVEPLIAANPSILYRKSISR